MLVDVLAKFLKTKTDFPPAFFRLWKNRVCRFGLLYQYSNKVLHAQLTKTLPVIVDLVKQFP